MPPWPFEITSSTPGLQEGVEVAAINGVGPAFSQGPPLRRRRASSSISRWDAKPIISRSRSTSRIFPRISESAKAHHLSIFGRTIDDQSGSLLARSR
jgi:hypothetical protein